MLVAEHEGRSGRRREDDIKVYLKEIVYESVEWIHLAQDRDQWRAVVNTGMNIEGGEFRSQLSEY
jgi:hypothetical protein